MPSPLQQAGATSEQSKFAPLHINRWFTGMWTQRSPLRDAATTYLLEKFYSASRFESMSAGVNVEVSSRLTPVRAPGSSVYNANIFPAIQRFYSFKSFSPGTEQIRVMADTKATVYDATAGGQIAIFNKKATAGKTSFLAVGDTLYAGDGTSNWKYVTSPTVWAAGANFPAGTFLVDSNLNIQVAVGSLTFPITNVALTSDVLTLTLTTAGVIDFVLGFLVGVKLSLQGLVHATPLNGQTITIASNPSYGSTITAPFTYANYGPAADSGTATTGSGISGAVQPTWATTPGAVTQDGGQQWICKGSAVQNWGIAGPTAAPTLAQAALPGGDPAFAFSTYYGVSLLILDTNNNLQLMTTVGTTGATQPTWATATGATTADGSCVWTNQGNGTRLNSHNYTIGQGILVTYHQTVSIPNPVRGYPPITYTVTYTEFFVCTTAGLSAATSPAFSSGTGTTVQDGTVVWTNKGTAPNWNTIGATTAVSSATAVLDTNGNIQSVTVGGKTAAGPTEPTWSTVLGGVTVSGTATFTMAGSYSAANTGTWVYDYDYGNSTVENNSTASPLSATILLAAGNYIVIQGVGSGDPQVDTINIYRSLQGFSTPFLLASIPNPGAGITWTYNDTSPDTSLNEFIEANLDSSANPPPAGAVAPVYHLGCIFVAVNNVIYYSAGPTDTNGVGNEAFPPLNFFEVQDQVTKMRSTTIGLLVYTTTQIMLIAGDNDTTSALVPPTPYAPGYGLLSYDAETINGSTIYIMDSTKRCISFDPNAGILEVGFPIGDQLASTYNATNAYASWHSQGSGETALYLADGTYGWWRMSPTASPESGFTWSPRRLIQGGTSAVQSVETQPGAYMLLIGPPTSGPILQRDISSTLVGQTTVNGQTVGGYRVYTNCADNGAPYPAFVIAGNVVMAQSGQVAECSHIAATSMRLGGGTPVQVSVLLGEIATTTAQQFQQLYKNGPEPPILETAQTVYSNRHNFLQNGDPALCQHLQIMFAWGETSTADEILTATLVAGLQQDVRMA